MGKLSAVPTVFRPVLKKISDKWFYDKNDGSKESKIEKKGKGVCLIGHKRQDKKKRKRERVKIKVLRLKYTIQGRKKKKTIYKRY